MNKKAISSKELDQIVAHALYREAEETNIEIGKALKDISESKLKEILNGERKQRSFKKIIWERIAWSVSVAALLAVAVSLPIAIEKNAKNEICNIVYSYNAPELNEMINRSSRSSEESLPEITIISDKELKKILPDLESSFYDSDNLQEIYIKGKILAFSYIRLHKRKEAINILEHIIEKLSKDEDYTANVQECQQILDQIK